MVLSGKPAKSERPNLLSVRLVDYEIDDASIEADDFFHLTKAKWAIRSVNRSSLM